MLNRKKFRCVCGQETEEHLGNVEFENFGDVVLVENFPQVQCSKCTEVLFTRKVARQLEIALNYAKNNALKTVNFRDFASH